MRNLLAAAFVALLAARAPAQGALVAHSWRVGAIERTGLVAEPAPNAGRPAPLVLVFHGHGGTPALAARTMGIHAVWPEALVIYLQGLPTVSALVDPQGRLPGWQMEPGALGDRDIALVDTVLAWAERTHAVDTHRVYAAGHSNGARMVYVLWATRASQFAAFAAASAPFGTMIMDALPKPAIIIAGDHDELVPIAVQKRSILQTMRLNYVDNTGSRWAPDATLYHSSMGADLVVYEHAGGHPLPSNAATMVARFFREH